MKNSNGNALFLVLIAVALFAALSYAVTQTGRGGASVDKEKAGINASQIVQYFSAMEAAVNKLKLVNGCTETQISFQRDWNDSGAVQDIAADAYNASAPADGSCHIFDANGAAFIYNPMPEGSQTLTSRIAIQDIGTASQDIIAALMDINQATCQEINRGFGIDVIPNDTHGSVMPYFDGTFPASVIVGDEDVNLAGQRSICFYDDDHFMYIFYHLMVPR
jgi:hypothetical protein